MKKELDETKKIKEEVDQEKPLPVKIGISAAAAVVVGGVAWFGIKDRNATILGALGSLALTFFLQKWFINTFCC